MTTPFSRSGALGVLVAACAVAAACGAKSPTSATPPPGNNPPAGGAQTIVRIVDAVTGNGVAGVTGTIDTQTSRASDGGGQSTVWAQQAGKYTVTFSGSSIRTRTTSINVPSAETPVSVISGSFDLTAFDQMIRSSGKLQRWTAAPPLVVLTRVVQYESNTSNTLTALSDEIDAADQQALVRDLSDGFAILTDHQLGTFSSVTFETPDPGSRVNVMRTGAILVARSKGLTLGSRYWGYGRWATTSSGVVVGGNIMVDADFDGGDSQYKRCLRIHELGHALGYNHVDPSVRASVMNSAANYEPNAWDLQAVHIAFLRPPGNVSPDTDPSSFTVNARTGAVIWSPPIF